MVTKAKPRHKIKRAIDMHAHDTNSLFDGMGKPEDVVARAVELGWPAVALTNHGGMGGTSVLYKAAKAAGIKPLPGNEFYICHEDHLGVKGPDSRWNHYHLTVLALSKEGYHNLVAWTTFSHRRENYYDRPRISITAMAEVAPYPLHHNVVLSGCLASEFCHAISNGNSNWLEAGISYTEAIKSLFPNFYLEVQDHYIEKFYLPEFKSYYELIEKEELMRDRIQKIAAVTGLPIVVTNDSHLQKPSQRKSHMAMLASSWKHSERRQDAKGGLVIGQEQLERYVYFGNAMRQMDEIADSLDNPQAALDNIIDIVNESNVVLDPLDSFSYSLPTSGYKDPLDKARRRGAKRLKELVKLHGKEAQKRFDFELESMGDFAHYLLLMSDFILFAKKQGILTNTRGSVGNSLLCYCLNIHDLDPIVYKLPFERFFNPARKKVPDIDIDIEKDRFDDFMRFVIEHMEELEGKGQVVQIANYGTMANRSAFRMIAEALGIEKERIDEIAKLLPSMIDSGMVEQEDDVYLDLENEFPDIHELASGIFDNLKSVSQHACGWLFGTADRPIEEWIPMVLITSSGTQVTQFNMKALEDWGMVKGDFLRLKTLSVIQRTRKMLGQNSLDIQDIPIDDPKTYELLRSGETEGVFSLQGKTQRRGCMEVGVENIEDVIAVQALYRPSGTRTGFDKHFCDRKHGREKFTHINEITKQILGHTYGFPIFQDQILELGLHFGMSHAELQDLLDAIKKAKGIGRGAAEAFEKVKPMFMGYATQFMDKSEAKEIWALMDAFQGYGFNCHTGDTVVYQTNSRREITIKELYDGPQDFQSQELQLSALKNGQIRTDRCIGVLYNGEQEVWEIELKKGQKIRSTKDHLFMTSSGWIRLKNLRVSDRIMVDVGSKYFEYSEIVSIAYRGFEPVYDLVMEGDEHNFVANGMVTHNCAHATSYAILAVRAAYLKTHYPQEFYTSLLDVYPEKSKYIASARAQGFKFLPPDINESRAGFNKGKKKNEIRVGLSAIKGLGGVTVQQIITGQPFSSIEDLKQRTTNQALNKTRIEILAEIGALRSLGIKGGDDDLRQYEILGFTLDQPEAFSNVEPRRTNRNTRGNWTHRGLQRHIEITEGPTSISKLFWIPPKLSNEKMEKSVFQKQTSSMGKTNEYLLRAIDENGIPFDIAINESKSQAKVLQLLAEKCRGKVVCIDGAVRQPFKDGAPMMYRFFKVTGTYNDDAQIFGIKEPLREAISVLTQQAVRRDKNNGKST